MSKSKPLNARQIEAVVEYAKKSTPITGTQAEDMENILRNILVQREVNWKKAEMYTKVDAVKLQKVAGVL